MNKMTNNHEIKLAKVGELVLVSGCEKPVPTRNFRILQAEKGDENRYDESGNAALFLP